MDFLSLLRVLQLGEVRYTVYTFLIRSGIHDSFPTCPKRIQRTLIPLFV